ncbi:YisL family protein [Paenibacillus sp. y28]|uniref:YisL family protein n=1 Tax=Paenibacillus sp. y28 TaxID=3129110 RepID=UPI003016BDD9
MNAIIHAHTDSWPLLFLLFVLSCIFIRTRALHMILRLMYIVMIVSGGTLLYSYGFPLSYSIKGVLALILIYIMEKILGSRRRQSWSSGQKAGLWIAFSVITLLIVLLGYGVISL